MRPLRKHNFQSLGSDGNQRDGAGPADLAAAWLRQVTFRHPGKALELPFDIAATRFNARAELFEYPPLAMIDPGVTSRVPGVIRDDRDVRVGVMVAR